MFGVCCFKKRAVVICAALALCMGILSACDGLPFELPFDLPEINITLPSFGSGASGGGGSVGVHGGNSPPGNPSGGGSNTPAPPAGIPAPPHANDPDRPLRDIVSAANVPAVSTGTEQVTQGGLTLDFSNIDRGYFMARYTGGASRIVIRVESPLMPQQYDYFMTPSERWEVFSFSRGSGQYTITVLENVEGQMFSSLYYTTLTVNLVNDLLPFLYPNQYVNFNSDSRAVALARELADGARSELDVVHFIYHHIITNITYDHEFAAQVTGAMITTYLPDVDSVLARGRGICFDYAALMAAMLRSQRIPTRIEIGFVSGGIYHAWVTVYTEESGWVGVVEFASGGNWTLMDPTFSSANLGSNQFAQFIGDGTNYQTLFIR